MDSILSIEQMKELDSLGIDTSDANCMWISILDRYTGEPTNWMPIFRDNEKVCIEQLRKVYPETYKEGNLYYCYTISDILNKLPLSIEKGILSYKRLIEDNVVKYHCFSRGITLISCQESDKLIDNLFDMLKKLKEENYI